MSLRIPENFIEAEENAAEPMDSKQNLKEALWALSVDDAETTETEALQTRIGEQSSLICLLKHRTDDLLLRCEALQEINAALQDRMTTCQRERDAERRKVEIIEKRFMHLVASNQAIITFKDEYKKQNAQLLLENKHLKLENDSLFSKKLHDKEKMLQELTQEMKDLTEKYTDMERDSREKLSGLQSKLQEQTFHYQAKETTLRDKLSNAEQIHKDLKQKLKKTEEELTSKEANLVEKIGNLAKEKDKLVQQSRERDKLLQETQAEAQQLDKKLKEEKKLRIETEKRFEKEAEAVRADVKVKALQSNIEEFVLKSEEMEKNFKAFREHSSSLLTQERELNKKLRHLNFGVCEHELQTATENDATDQ